MRVPVEARVEVGAIGGNVGLLRERARGAEVMAMVKAEAYGHGLAEAARAALAGGASWLGVAKLAEALRLRDEGITVRTLVCVGVPGEPYAEAVARDVDLTVGAVWLLDEVVRAAEAAGRPARVHLKADTGMSRGGARGGDWDALVGAALKAEAAGHVRVVGAMSHFACADEPGHPSIAAQLAAFTDMVAHAEKAGARFEVRHLANSAATLTLPEARFDLVRPGIATYGLTPVPSLGTFGLRPAMTLVADAALVKRVPAGSGVSYGHTYRTERETTLAVVPAGYGDGIPRHGSNVLEVLAGGRRRRIAGRVCMDQFVIDLGDDALAAGDEIILFGPGDRGEPTAQEWADALGTISYEIVTRIGSRVPRAYPGGAL
ncbi:MULTISPECIES: alanine racemase [Actinomadura]|uniref:alanine racemase n=1 Tax=Actinomadura TaxID=1988 RepID=UPI000465B07E|nr:alanine racemase [Actinomadura madurae]MCP9953065.1 alanine racemase [Actinomadura madurae]MCP9969832.1 alanine racemase [Actinomadura madurae]MCP9982283.1 alanine racemase [Actinomadura madurae]MCQ0006188.1 alanine racemase [Actinomadura madurae]MCQ0018530.1 alanine racemase [Actinomadura madurae]